MDILKIFLIIAFIFVTICTIKLHPDIHQPMIIEDADFKLTRISDTLSTNTISVKSTEPQQTQQSRQTSVVQEVQHEKIVNIHPQPVESSERTKIVQVETQNPTKSDVKIQNTQPQVKKIPKKNEEFSDDELIKQVLKGIEEQTGLQLSQPPKSPQTNQQKSQQQTEIQPKPKPNNDFKNPYMTEQEEIIAWNKWRSNIQNQIMKDSNIEYAPLGTVFMFTFVVDKFGNISNIKVECSNPNYMDIARNNVKPAISRLQKSSILNFPRGTQRTSTVVTGLFLIGTQERYSTPNDFSDYERVKY